ncbi:MAG: hypothetical protein ABIH38_02445 [Patescibacteria group bacterium]
MFSFVKRLLSVLKFGVGALLLIAIAVVGTFVFCFSNLKMIAGGILILAYAIGLLPVAALIIGVGLFALVVFNLALGLPIIMNNGEWVLN